MKTRNNCRFVGLSRSLLLAALVLIATAFRSAAGGYKIIFQEISFHGEKQVVKNTMAGKWNDDLYVTYNPDYKTGRVLPARAGETHRFNTSNRFWYPTEKDGANALHGGPVADYYFWNKNLKGADDRLFKMTLDLPSLAGKGMQEFSSGNWVVKYTVVAN